jgi:hypothetical protein
MDRALKDISRRYDASEAAMARPPLDLLVDHIEHIAKVAGIDHVGLGSDFDGVTALPEGRGRLLRAAEPDASSPREGLFPLGRAQDPRREFPPVMEQSIDRVAPQRA